MVNWIDLFFQLFGRIWFDKSSSNQLNFVFNDREH